MHFDLQANDWNEKSQYSLRMLFHDLWTVRRISIFSPHRLPLDYPFYHWIAFEIVICSVTFNVTFDVFTLLFPTSTVVSVDLLYSLFLINMGPLVITENSQYSCNKITKTWIQISSQNWFGIFSNVCHQMTFWLIPIVSRSKSN